MRWKSLVSAVLLSGAAMLLPAAPAGACSCITTTPCKATWWVDAVFVGRIRAFETEPVTIGQHSYESVRRVLLDVTERFRGDVGDSLALAPGDGTCSFPFKAGQSYVVYARRSVKGDWSTSLCSGTKAIENAAADLTYLRSLAPPAGSTARLQGRVHFSARNPTLGSGAIAARGPVRVTLRNGSRETQTPVGADWSIDTPITPGTYAVEVQAPAGYYALVDRELVVPHVRACPTLYITVSWDGHLKGRVIDARGRGVRGVNVEARRAMNTPGRTALAASTITDAAGAYDLAHLSAGVYRVVVNIGWNGVISRVQKPRVYHPGTTDAALAADVPLRPSELVTLPDLRMPQDLALATLSGVVRNADGQLAAGVRIVVQEDASGHPPSVPPHLAAGSEGYGRRGPVHGHRSRRRTLSGDGRAPDPGEELGRRG